MTCGKGYRHEIEIGTSDEGGAVEYRTNPNPNPAKNTHNKK